MNASLRFTGDLYSELDRLQQQLDQFFRPVSEAASIRAVSRSAFPPINIGHTPDTVEVVAFAPGLDPKNLQVTVDRGLLVIAGERKAESDGGNRSGSSNSTYAQERFRGAFRRVVNLPEDADPAKVDASYRDGCLRVTIAKRESSKPRQISVH